ARELGVAPSAATVGLYEQIRNGTLVAIENDAAPQSAGWPTSRQSNLPLETTAFVGREAELGVLAARLAEPNVRLLTILGLGGMGKTRLAQAAASAQKGRDGRAGQFANGVIFVSLARLEAPDQLLPVIAEAVDLRFVAGREPKAQLLNFFRQKAM